MGNQIKVDQAGATDDIYPARKERLGQYLADYTSENMANPDIRGGGKNAYPISPPGEETTRGFTDAVAFTDVSTAAGGQNVYSANPLGEAVRIFENLSNQAAFEPEV